MTDASSASHAAHSVKHAILYGIDPGSSKDWAIYRCEYSFGPRKPRRARDVSSDIVALDQLIGSVISDACEPSTAVMLALDVPITGRPKRFAPQYVCDADDLAHFPFNVNEFSTRCCERALNAVPKVAPHEDVGELLDMLGQLCRWKTPYDNIAKGPKELRNIAFQKKEDFEGVSVIQYLTAPHQHVCGLLQDRLRDAVDTEPQLSMTLKPPESVEDIVPSLIYLLESHPAVTMGFWLADERLQSLEYIPIYKGGLKAKSRTFSEFEQEKKRRAAELPQGEELKLPKATFKAAMRRRLAEDVLKLAGSQLATTLEDSDAFFRVIERDEGEDKLDAFVALLNVVELCEGKGDWFGTDRGGYFLTPRLPRLVGARLFSSTWKNAELRIEARNMEAHKK